MNSDNEEDAQDNGEQSEWVDITDFILNLEECTLDDSTINFSLENNTTDVTFSLFLTNELIEKIITETNKYASEYNTKKNNKNGIKRKSRLLPLIIQPTVTSQRGSHNNIIQNMSKKLIREVIQVFVVSSPWKLILYLKSLILFSKRKLQKEGHKHHQIYLLG